MKLYLIIIIAFVVLAIWLGSGFYIYITWDENDRGTIGDMFGAVNALFAGLAFTGIIYTIAIQRKELALQREATDNSTKELAGQRYVMNLQRFENTFFNMIELHFKIIDGIVYNNNQQISGRDFFQKNYVKMKSKFAAKASLQSCYEEHLQGYHSNLVVYTSSLVNLIKYVHRSDNIEDKDRITYINILFSLTTPAEKAVTHTFFRFNPSFESSELLEQYGFYDGVDILNG